MIIRFRIGAEKETAVPAFIFFNSYSSSGSTGRGQYSSSAIIINAQAFEGYDFFCHTGQFPYRFWKKCRKEAEKQKKAGRIPVRENVGSAKNLLPERQRNAQQDTKTQWSLLVFRCLGAKEHILKLGGFTFSFAEITDEMSTENGFREGGIRFQNTIYILFRENQAFFRLFSENL